MPIYEYRCRDCGEALEVRQAFTDDALTECPNCTGSLRKIFSTPGISFKGSGFYKTDSRSGGSESQSGGSSSSTSTDGDAAKSASSESGSSESGSSSGTSEGSGSSAPAKSDATASAGKD